MTRIVIHTAELLVVESKPRFAFGIVLVLGVLATVGALFGMIDPRDALSIDDVLGIILGPLLVGGGLLLYRETTTTFDKPAGVATWKRRGLVVDKSDRARFEDIQDVVVGRPVSDQSGGATGLVVVLSDRYWPLAFGFSALNQYDAEIIASILGAIRGQQP